MTKEIITITKKEDVNKSIKAIGQELIRRADDISKDVEMVSSITINAVLTPTEVVNFDITKNHTEMFESEVK